MDFWPEKDGIKNVQFFLYSLIVGLKPAAAAADRVLLSREERTILHYYRRCVGARRLESLQYERTRESLLLLKGIGGQPINLLPIDFLPRSYVQQVYGWKAAVGSRRRGGSSSSRIHLLWIALVKKKFLSFRVDWTAWTRILVLCVHCTEHPSYNDV